jgi:ketosteroid isomerase-like protein
MIRTLLIATTCSLAITASAQNEPAVLEPIRVVFDAMKKGDSAALRTAFHPDAVLFTVVNDPKTGQPSLRKETLKEFLTAIGTPHKDVYNELTWGEKVFIDGDFAQVWTDYAFYLNRTFSHCGVDAFQLIRNAAGKWLIFGLEDTRRKTGCTVPEEVSKRLK